MRYKIVARIVLILSFFNFVFTAPVEVRGAYQSSNNVVGRGGPGGDATIMSQGGPNWQQWFKDQPNSWPVGPEPDQLLEESPPLNDPGPSKTYCGFEIPSYLTEPPLSLSGALKEPVQLGSSTWEIGPPSSTESENLHSDLDPLRAQLPPPGQEGYLAESTAQQSRPKPQSTGFFNKLVSKMKGALRKLFGKFKFRPRFLRRISGTANRAVNVA